MARGIAQREQFPALHQEIAGRIPIFLDGPAGTQVPRRVIEAMVHYLSTCNANAGGVFATSVRSDALIAQSHQAVADLLNAPSPEEIIFGPNMTTLTFHLSRSFARILRPGDRLLVTRMDHDANIRPWMLAAREAGAEVGFVDIHPQDCTLDLEDLKRQLGPEVKLVAATCASNATGTLNDVQTICGLAHDVGARVFLDAVHHAPHGLMDVQQWGCDFLACSAYKFFGPHVGILWGKRALLEELPVDKVRPAPEELPHRWMTGTPNHEGLAGVTAAIDYLADLLSGPPGQQPSRRERLRESMKAIREYETLLVGKLLAGLADRPGFRVWGISDPARLGERVPTVVITSEQHTPEAIARHLAQRQIFVWHGHVYAMELAERLGVLAKGGFVRLGLVHYNLPEEVDRVLAALDELPS
jgi:cysteine desulfurase family protein (TIGR01976 family)